MKSFDHFNASSLGDAVSILKAYEGKAAIIAGGTDLLGTLKDNVHPFQPKALVNIKTIPGLAYIREDEGGLKIGPLTKLQTLERNPVVREKYSLLAEAARAVASPQIRRMGTIGGNICQETRCWYYRNPENTFYCTRKDGKICSAITGENRYHSIFGAARVGTTPCTLDCPGNIRIPDYLAKIREGDLKAAADILLASNPVPAVTGRVCPHFCERECNRDPFDESVSIRNVERFLGDYILEHGSEILMAPEVESLKRVAIVGSGPAGLSAAFYLRRSGHQVTVHEKMPEPGGMLTYGIPAYRLPKDMVRRVVKAMEAMGVEFKTGIDVGQEIPLATLRKGFDALFLASGAWGQPSIGLEGEDLTHPGLAFLQRVNLGLRDAPGKKVLVIGGGNVAVDVGVSARRLGAEEVTLVCLETRKEMPALDWEIEQALKEGVKLMPGWGPVKVLETGGKVTGLDLVRCTSVFDEKGRFSPTLDRSVKEHLDADRIFLAVGQKTDLSYVDADLPMSLDRGLIQVDKETQATGTPGIFAGGEVTTGPATVIEALAAGRKAAYAIHRYLGGRQKEPDAMQVSPLLTFHRDCLLKSKRAKMPERPVSERNIDREDTLGLDWGELEKEAKRCFNCGCVAVNPSDLAPALIALDAKIRTTRRTVDAESFFAVGARSSTILEKDELIREIQLPSWNHGSRFSFLKFRKRKAIDFPMANVACALKTKSGKVVDARIVLGALAPVPLRMRAAENVLMGKEITEEVAKDAAKEAVKAALPLTLNDYKVRIAETLVRRAILGEE